MKQDYRFGIYLLYLSPGSGVVPFSFFLSCFVRIFQIAAVTRGAFTPDSRMRIKHTVTDIAAWVPFWAQQPRDVNRSTER